MLVATYYIDPKDVKECIQEGDTITSIKMKRKYGKIDRKIIKETYDFEYNKACDYKEPLFNNLK